MRDLGLDCTRENGQLAAGRRAVHTRTQRRRRFHVEALEDRTLLTILFTPQQGAPTVTDGGGARLGTVPWGMPLYTIFWGSYWTNPNGKGPAQQTALENSLNSMLHFSGDLDGLHQYGVPYPAGVPGAGTVEVNDTSDPPNGFDVGQLQSVISNAITNLGLPDSDTYPNEGLYLVFTPPNINDFGGDAGYHASYGVFDGSCSDFDLRHYAWIGNFISQDYITNTIDHEVKEAMTDPNGDGITLTNGEEICDGEAQNYAALINGYEVATFWSAADNAYAVDDDNTQVITFDNGNLIVNGGQLGYFKNDTISVDLNSEGGVLITMNGESFSFSTQDPTISQVSHVTINLAGGNDTVNILHTTSSAPVTINDGSGNDSVIISPNDRLLDHIQGNVTVNGGSGYGTLTIDDQNDAFGGTYTMTGSTFKRSFSALVSYNLMNVVTVNGGLTSAATYDVQGTESFFTTNLNTGSGGNSVNVHGTSGTLNLASGGHGTVAVGSSGSVQGIYGTVNIERPPSFATLTVDDSLDPTGRTVALDTFTRSGNSPWVSITGLAPAAINFEQEAVHSPVTINGGLGGNTFTVVSLPRGTIDLNTGGGNDIVSLQTTSGSLVVNGQGGTNTLVGPNANETWSIIDTNTGSIGGVTFSGFPNLTGGTGMDVFLFSNHKGVTGAINGSGGGDWLDYSAYTTAVTVNLATGAATGVGGGVTGVQNVRGGRVANILTGNAQGNILIGGLGTDTLTGGSGRSILIAHKGAGQITGGSGTDILIGGKTSYDASSMANDVALEDILAEWQSSDSYTTRISNIKKGLGKTAGHRLRWTIEVQDNGVADALTAAPTPDPPVSSQVGDWFFKGAADTIKNKESYEVIN